MERQRDGEQERETEGSKGADRQFEQEGNEGNEDEVIEGRRHGTEYRRAYEPAKLVA
jgi:hypothetical protein